MDYGLLNPLTGKVTPTGLFNQPVGNPLGLPELGRALPQAPNIEDVLTDMAVQEHAAPPNPTTGTQSPLVGSGEEQYGDLPQSSPTGSLNSGYGGVMGSIGTVAGMGLGAPGLGLGLNAIGTAIDARNVGKQMTSAGMKPPGAGEYLSGVLNNSTFGLFGNDVNDIPGIAGVQGAHNAHARGVHTGPGGGWVEDDEADRRAADGQSAVDPNAHARGVHTGPGGGWKEDDEADQDQGADDSVICTELHRQGYETDEFMALDRKFGLRQSSEVMSGYHWWAKPLVRGMRRSWLLTQVVRFVSAPIRQEIAYRMGGNVPFTVLGSLMLDAGRWFCRKVSDAKDLHFQGWEVRREDEA
jgi:hypothetical protein